MNDWQGRAKREAAALLAAYDPNLLALDRDTLVDLLAAAWLQGTIYGSHETLAKAEIAFGIVQDSLL